MTFFYREREWYAGQFMRKIKAKFELNQYTGLYFETILSGLSPFLLSGLVRGRTREYRFCMDRAICKAAKEGIVKQDCSDL